MRPLSLHTKTTLLAAIIILFLLMATLFVFSLRVSEKLRQNQEEITELQAESLAGQISEVPPPRDYRQIARLVELVRAARPSVKILRVWEREGNIFALRISSLPNEPQQQLNEDIKTALRGANGVRIQEFEDVNAPVYRVFIPIFEGQRVSGAVEIVENMETGWTLIRRYFWNELWLAVISMLFLSLAVYALFRHFVYQPLDALSLVMQRAKAGELEARAEIRANDEIGELANEFNRMLAQISEFSAEREKQKDVLQENVREATTELQVKNDQLSEANREIWRTSRKMNELERLAAAGQTAAQFAHEVGTPLNLISGHVQLLSLNPNGNEKERNRLETISTQIERIERIVRGMLDRTRVDGAELQTLSLTDVLKKVFEAIAPPVEARKIKLYQHLSKDLPLINGNADRLQQVFINLINNALDAMPEGGKLRVSTSSKAENVTVEIADNGSGMSAETKVRIFEPLYTTKAKGRGTGLGLVVVRQIMLEHNGEIFVESELEKGTTFRLEFPKIL